MANLFQRKRQEKTSIKSALTENEQASLNGLLLKIIASATEVDEKDLSAEEVFAKQ